ncbi:MAG: Xaa-Pro aminopeptidase [Candidatus Fischerbacteria bacterium RBG_13_37_8]|uniref:Xaa-Pro aminopeptidase n=1 Tax=Candidatus Fischerbacteria bacterium RBG_13_37_8 TaxID=1817863 RepID=A0A1F5VX49_9BACT|nr:MAG: Xaa-Pro aminopeptidase [Candidatus Fischerbacteria bacterium RBG_13_37_8]
MRNWVSERLFMFLFAFLLIVLSAGQINAEEQKLSLLSLSWSEQIKVRESWLEKKHNMILDMMRRNKIAMWIVVTEEFHPDPLVEFIAPPRPDVAGRDFFIFIDTREKGLKKIATASFTEENLKRFFETSDEPKPAKELLPEIIKTYNPKDIALSIDGKRGPTRSLTRASYEFLVEILGKKTAKRFVSAEPLIEEYLDTRLPEEKPYFEQIAYLTNELGRRALSNEVVIPGKTTVGDIRNWLYDQLGSYCVSTWFQPDIRIQRKGMKDAFSRGFLAVALEDTVIQPGDLLHLDFGITYMGLNSDWQKMAYVLLPGETDVPEGLKKGLANTNKLQDTICLVSKPGRLTTYIYDDAMAGMEKLGITAQVYSHAVGNHGHGIGPTIDFRAKKRDDTAKGKRLRAGSYFAIELNTKMKLPEWDNQEICIMEEDSAWLSDQGWVYFTPRQESFLLIK